MAKFRIQGGLDDFIRHRGITDPLIVAILRNHILCLLFMVLIASSFVEESYWGMWMCAGYAVMTFILYSWAKFFSLSSLQNFGIAFIQAVLFRFLLRIAILAVALYFCLVRWQADPMALLSGIAAGTLVPILTWVWERNGSKK